MKYFLIVIIVTLFACTNSYQLSPPDKNMPAIPEAFYKNASINGQPVFKVDAQRSEAIIKVYRGGTLKTLGHDHVVATHALAGYIAIPTQGTGRADLIVQLNSLTVDEPALRTQMGFNTQLTQTDIAGTREHMLVNTLDAEHFPVAYVHIDGFIEQSNVSVQLTLHGVTREYSVPITHLINTEGSLIVAGALTVKQTDFGITPFSILGGMLQVEDAVDVQFKIYTSRVTP